MCYICYHWKYDWLKSSPSCTPYSGDYFTTEKWLLKSQIGDTLAKRESKVHCTCLDIFQHFFWLILWKHKTLPHNYSSTMVVCLHSSMVQISKKFNMPSDKLVIFPTEFLQPRKKLIFPYRICKFSYWNKRPSYS